MAVSSLICWPCCDLLHDTTGQRLALPWVTGIGRVCASAPLDVAHWSHSKALYQWRNNQRLVSVEGTSPATNSAPVATVLGAGVGAILGGLVLGPAGILLGLIGGGMMGAVADQQPRKE